MKKIILIIVIVIVIISLAILTKKNKIEVIDEISYESDSIVFNNNSNKYEFYNDLSELLYESENKEETERYKNDYENIYRDIINDEAEEYKESESAN